MPSQYPGTYTWKYGRNDVDGFRVMHIRSFRFIFILRVAPQQTHAAVAVVRAGYPSPDYRQNHNRRKSKAKLTKMQLHDILRRGCSKSGIPYVPYLKA